VHEQRLGKNYWSATLAIDDGFDIGQQMWEIVFNTLATAC